ncbi:2Fe-2S iron-sulfur cluster-binding protein [Aureimonas populi]|uniref:2Fe-2S iron-sulfur cluster-binding protein n=1 Tax=Aureimonas populi TaxID=1701758 RepID=A0ABW5CLB9_9HYPH|nr:2Fe-2S iron-sulfur cluster-binding protein [Aureimonas populi]
MTFRSADGGLYPVETQTGVSLMQAAVLANVPGIEAECGGACVCATCHVYVDARCLEAAGEARDDEREMLELVASERRENSRLSCQIEVVPELDRARIDIPEAQY